MSMPILTKFDPATIALMQSILKQVVARMPVRHRTSSNQTAIASRILARAAEGHLSHDVLLAAALEEDGSICRPFANPKAA